MDRADHVKEDWLLLVATKLRADGVDTEGELPMSVAERYYDQYPALSPRDAVSLYLAQRSRLSGPRTIVAKDIWIDRFVDHLGHVSSAPELTSPGVLDFAELTYQLAWDLVPEQVAESYVAAHGGRGDDSVKTSGE